MTNRLRPLAAWLLLASGLGGVAVGAGVYVQAWHNSWEYARSGEADRLERQVVNFGAGPEWLEDAPPTNASPEELELDASPAGSYEPSLFTTPPTLGLDLATQPAPLATQPAPLAAEPGSEPEPRATSAEIELVASDFRFFDPPEAGAHARLAVELRSHAPFPSEPISLSIPAGWFEDYRIIGAIPAVIDDRLGPDGSRQFEFPGLAADASASLELHLAAVGDNVNPPEARLALPDGGEIGQARPRTVAPRPRPGPASAVSIPRLGIQARVVPTAWEPVPFLVGQIQGSANLSEGNSVLIGHLSGPAGNVFANLDRVRPGDEVVAVSRGLEYRFTISDKMVLPGSDTSPIQKTDTPRLTLMTCTGQWNPLTQDYTHRLWVTAEPPELAQKTIAANAERAARAAAEAERAAQIAAAAAAQAAATADVTARTSEVPSAAGPAAADSAVPTMPPPVAAPTPPAAGRPPPAAGLAIHSPASEARVPPRFVVRGTRSTPVDSSLHLWLLARAEVEGSRWYLLPREIVSGPDGSWQAELHLGGPPNTRHELRVGVVDARSHAALARRVAERPNEPLDDLPRGFSDEASVVVTRQ